MTFSLPASLEAETCWVHSGPLSEVLLMSHQIYPWLVLVPRVPECSELSDLTAEQRRLLIEEIAAASQSLRDVAVFDKINVGALGNMLPTLHVHVLGRSKTDPAWPGPVWGRPPLPETPERLAYRQEELKTVCQKYFQAIQC